MEAGVRPSAESSMRISADGTELTAPTCPGHPETSVRDVQLFALVDSPFRWEGFSKSEMDLLPVDLSSESPQIARPGSLCPAAKISKEQPLPTPSEARLAAAAAAALLLLLLLLLLAFFGFLCLWVLATWSDPTPEQSN